MPHTPPLSDQLADVVRAFNIILGRASNSTLVKHNRLIRDTRKVLRDLTATALLDENPPPPPPGEQIMQLKDISTNSANDACINAAILINKSTQATKLKEKLRILRLTVFLDDVHSACTRRDQAAAKRKKPTDKNTHYRSSN